MSVSAKVSITKMLREWREVQAATENVELYRILQNDTINLIADTLPETNVDLLAIKGLGPKKVQKYGVHILKMVASAQVAIENTPTETDSNGEKVLSVTEFLGTLNYSLAKHTVRVHGEVYDRVQVVRNGVYFSIKDPDQEAMMSCFAWKNVFEDKGVWPEPGLSVSLSGVAQIYVPKGRFSLNVRDIELRGEGALQAAYEKLRLKLEKEGLFKLENKRKLVALPRHIALITADGSDAQKDFLTHINQHGFKVDHYNVRVEGLSSEREIIAAINRVNQSGITYDALVITRGGGSLEALQSFNSEAVVRSIIASKVIVVSAVGHERDITLCDLAADIRCSTPTDAGKMIDTHVRNYVETSETNVNNQLQKFINSNRQTLNVLLTSQNAIISAINRLVSTARHKFGINIKSLQFQSAKLDGILEKPLAQVRSQQIAINQSINQSTYQYQTNIRTIRSSFMNLISSFKNSLQQHLGLLDSLNPENVLTRGYSILSINGKAVTRISQVEDGTSIQAVLADGVVNATVTDTKPNSHYAKATRGT